MKTNIRKTENRFRSLLNQFIAKGDLLRNYGLFLVQLLRLRQCTGHPFMMEQTIKESWTLDDVREARQKLNAISSKNFRPFYERTRIWVKERSSSPYDGDEPRENNFRMEPERFGRGEMGNSFNMNQALRSLKKDTLEKRVQCGICGDFPVAPWTTDVTTR
jgi:hypothetical protein